MTRTQVPGQPTGAHWGEYEATTDLPNVAGSSAQTNFLNRGDLAAVGGELYQCTSPAEGAATWVEVATAGGTITSLTATGAIAAASLSVTGDITAGGGFRMLAGPFAAPGTAGVTAADQTNLDLYYEHSAGTSSFVAPRAGSIVGISGQLSASLTDGGGDTEDLVIAATVNGVEVALTATATVLGGETEMTATAAKDTYAFAAGALVGISYTSGTITNTPTLVATLEIEM